MSAWGPSIQYIHNKGGGGLVCLANIYVDSSNLCPKSDQKWWGEGGSAYLAIQKWHHLWTAPNLTWVFSSLKYQRQLNDYVSVLLITKIASESTFQGSPVLLKRGWDFSFEKRAILMCESGVSKKCDETNSSLQSMDIQHQYKPFRTLM